MFASRTPKTNSRRAAAVLCLSLFINTLAPLAFAQSPLKSPGKGAKNVQAEGAAQGQSKPVGGKTDVVVASATVNVKDIAAQSSSASKPGKVKLKLKTLPEPGKGPDDLALPEGMLKGQRPEPTNAPVSGANDGTLVASPAPSTSFQGLVDGQTLIPPDTMGAVGPNHVVTAINDNTRIHTRTGATVTTFSTNSFWAPVSAALGYAVSTFDPKIYFDRFSGRWIYTITANAQTANSALLLAVSRTDDPTGTWNLYGLDTDPTNTIWADYPSIGFNANWIVVQVNMFTNANNTFVRPDIYVFNKAQGLANSPTIGFTKFTGVNTGAPGAVTGSTWAPTIDLDNSSPNKLWFVQNWNSTAGLIRVSTLTGAVGAETINAGTQFPIAPFSWLSGQPVLIGGGWAPQAGATLAAPFSTHIMNNDARMQNAVYRNGAIWTAHTVFGPTVKQPAGSNPNTAANPTNHSYIQWWQVDAALEPGAFTTAPLQRNYIEDPLATNCFNGSNALVAGCTEAGTFYSFPNIAVNKGNDALIGFSSFAPNKWASASYAYRDRSDAPNTFRDPVDFKAGLARYGKSGNGQVRWGDYSAAMVDPLNDRDFWTQQEYAEARINADATSVWATWWAQLAVPAAVGDLVISEFRQRGPAGPNDEFIEIYNPNSAPHTVLSLDSGGYGIAASDGSVRCVIPNNTVIPGRGHFLCVNNAAVNSYSLTNYPAGEGTTATGDAAFTADIPDNVGIAIFNTAIFANFSAATRLDSVGFTTEANPLFKEGAGLPLRSATNIQYTMYRDLRSGSPKDTNDNLSDFIYADTAATDYNVACTGLPAGSACTHLGAPGPENLSSPIFRGDKVKASNIDIAQPSTAPPNRVRNLTSDPANNSTAGTLSFRRTFTNNTGAPVSRLRFRVVDITSFPENNTIPGTADLRVLSSTTTPVTVTGGGTVVAQGLTLETPPAQPNGGAYNSSLSAGTVTLGTPLAAGGTISVNFVLGVQTPGNFRFFIIVEALP